MNEIFKNILFTLTGALIGFLFTIGRDFLIDKRKFKRVRLAILAEIEANEEHSKKDYSKTSFASTLYESNLNSISGFNKKSIKDVVRYYTMITNFRDRFSEDISDRSPESKQLFTNKTLDMYEEIRTIGKQILQNER